MAGQKQPIDLVIAKGKKHLTKAEIKMRKNQEINVPFVDIQPPSYLTKKLQIEFNEIAEKLKSLNIMTELDVDCLARYLIAKQNYVKITKKLDKIITKKDARISEIDSLVSIQDKLCKQCRSSAGDLGLSISSRCKLIMPVDPTPPKKNKFDRFSNNIND